MFTSTHSQFKLCFEKSQQLMLCLWPAVPALQTALTTRGTAAAAPQGSSRRGQPAEPQSPPPKGTAAAAAAAAGDAKSAVSPQRKHVLDTLLPGYASRPNPSPVKKQSQQQQLELQAANGLGPNAGDVLSRRSVDSLPGSATPYNDDAALGSSTDGWPSSSAAAAASAEGVAASGLTGGGFILTDQQPSKQHNDDVPDGRLPTYNSSRHSQGRTLLQQHIMMQHDLKQQQMLAAQQQARMRREQLEKEQRQRQRQQQQVVLQKEQEQQSVLPVTKQEPQDMPVSPVPANEVLAAAAAAADHDQRLDSAQQQQQQSQQEQVSQGQQQSVNHLQQQQQQLPFELLLDQPPTVLTKAEHDRLLSLPLPAALRQQLLLAGHVESCYSFLLQQHIQPRWGRLADMMQQLFPQVGQLTCFCLVVCCALASRHAELNLHGCLSGMLAALAVGGWKTRQHVHSQPMFFTSLMHAC
jgi:hypothetical protein